MECIIKVKRIYEEPHETDGYRILVDRLWPRGLSKEKAKIDCWLKDIAPPTELRKWFNHEPEKFAEFKERYIAYLMTETPLQLINEIKKQASNHSTITLLYSAKDQVHNQAHILKDVLVKQ